MLSKSLPALLRRVKVDICLTLTHANNAQGAVVEQDPESTERLLGPLTITTVCQHP